VCLGNTCHGDVFSSDRTISPSGTQRNTRTRGEPIFLQLLGVKGAAQAGCIAAPQTIINAILDALAPLGIAHIDMAATPERIWRVVHSAQGG